MMKNNSREVSRRRFIGNVTGATAAMMLRPYWPVGTDDHDPEVNRIVAQTIGIDTHNHIDVPLNAAELPGPKNDLAGEMKSSGLSAICMTFAVDYQRLTNPGDAYDRFTNGLAAMDTMLETNNIKRAMNMADLRSAHAKHQPIVIQSVEGGHFLEGKIDRLGVAFGRGLRQLGLLHDSDASVPLGDVYTNVAKWGLTAFGSDVIKECNRLGILIDLTHCSNDTIHAALKVTGKPVIITHTGLDTQLGQDERMAKMMLPRLISKETAKTIAGAGAVIGVWTHLSDTALAYAQNIKAMVDVVGIDHVCIGTDTKLTPAYRSPNDNHFGGPPAQGPRTDSAHQTGANSKNNSQNAPGGKQKQGVRMGERTNYAWKDQKAGFYYATVQALLKTGFTETEIGKIGGGNFSRVFDAATAG